MPDCILHIKDHQITNRQVVANFFKELADGKYLLKADRVKRRSNNQNAYLHGVVFKMVLDRLRDLGWENMRTIEQVKEYLKFKFLRTSIINETTGEVIEFTKRTRDLKTVEMMDFIEDVARFCSQDLDFVLPMPNEQLVLLAHYDHSNSCTVITK